MMNPSWDGLLHGVGVEGHVLGPPALGYGVAEYLQGLVLRRGGEGEVAGVGHQLLRLHDAVDLVLGGLVVLLGARLSQRHGHRRRHAPALTGVGLVDNDGEPAPPMLVADGVQNEGEFLDRGDDDALAF